MADSKVWNQMLNDYAAPSIQVEGALLISTSNNDTQESDKVAMEISGELMLQAWAMQLLGIPPKTTPAPETIQCGFRYFDVQDVCPHQITDNCTGSFNPADGSPHPADLDDQEGLSGCPFEKLLWGAGIHITDIKLPQS
jgi:hypothetical protein